MDGNNDSTVKLLVWGIFIVVLFLALANAPVVLLVLTGAGQ